MLMLMIILTSLMLLMLHDFLLAFVLALNALADDLDAFVDFDFDNLVV